MGGMKSKATIITQASLLPLSLVLALAGGVYKFAEVSLAAETTRKDLEALSATVKDIQKSVVVSLNDQSSNIAELHTQVLLLDSKLTNIQETLDHRRPLR